MQVELDEEGAINPKPQTPIPLHDMPWYDMVRHDMTWHDTSNLSSLIITFVHVEMWVLLSYFLVFSNFSKLDNTTCVALANIL